jgi:phospholipid/cholesterol/gamma-HCH transport system substrate-binding protein
MKTAGERGLAGTARSQIGERGLAGTARSQIGERGLAGTARSQIRKNLADVLAIIGVVVLGLAIGAYILSNQRLRFPLLEEKPLTLLAELPDAQAVTPGQGQTVVVAGVRIGDMGSVELEDGRAVVEMQIDREHEGLVREGASALLRAKTGTKDMFVEVDPGEGRALEDGDRIQLANTLPDVDPDEFLSALDADTREYLQLLITGAGKGLEGRGTDLRETLRRLGPTHRDLARVTEAVAERRSSLRRLVNRYGLLTTELGKSDRDIARLVRASEAALGAFADEDENLSGTVARLPGTLRQTEETLGKVEPLADRMGPTFESLRPAFSKLDEANDSIRPFALEAAPVLEKRVRPFARVAQPFQRDLGAASKELAAAGPDMTKAFRGLNRLFNIGAYNPGGSQGVSEACELEGSCTREERARNEGFLYWLAWVGNNTTSLFSTADALGPIRRAYLLGLNCNIVSSGAEVAGVPAAEVQPLVDLLGGTGVCAKP